jgi:hypothetical protein
MDRQSMHRRVTQCRALSTEVQDDRDTARDPSQTVRGTLFLNRYIPAG